MHVIKFTIITAIVAGLLCKAAFAQLVSKLDVDIVAKQSVYIYTYTLTNKSNSPLVAAALNILVDPGAEISALSSPEGWKATFDTDQKIITWEIADLKYAVSPNDKKTFSFQSPKSASPHAYSIFGIDGKSPTIETNEGTILSPGNTVP